MTGIDGKMDDLFRASLTFKFVIGLSSVSLLLNWALLSEKMPESVRVAFYCLAIVANAVFAFKDNRMPDMYQELYKPHDLKTHDSKTIHTSIARVVLMVASFLWFPAGFLHVFMVWPVMVWPIIIVSVVCIVLQTFIVVMALSFLRSKAAGQL